MTSRPLRLSPVFLQILVLCALVTTGFSWRPAPSFQPTSAEIRLVDLMALRLELSRQVAWVKYLNTAPIYDPKREAELMGELILNGEKLGLPA
ncbi:MAG: chorismate mutase [Chthoniobacterales bacterium]